MSRTKQPEKRSSGTLQQKRVQLDWPEDRDLRILAIDGGGIKGIFSAAFLSELERQYLDGEPISKYFDYICGTSTGGIIALGLGAGFTAQELLEMYIDEGEKIFPPARFKVLRSIYSLVLAPYCSKTLECVIRGRLKQKLYGDSKTRLCIPSFDGKHGEVFVYKTNHHPDYKKDHLEEMVTIGMATSAAPTFLRSYSDGKYQLVDGGVWANNPIMIGLVDALSCYNVSRDKVKILSIGCGGEPYKTNVLHRFLGGMLLWVKVIFAAMSLQSQNAIGQAGLLIGRNKIVRVDPDDEFGFIKMDDYRRSSELFPDHAKNKVEINGERIKEMFFGEEIERYEPFNL